MKKLNIFYIVGISLLMVVSLALITCVSVLLVKTNKMQNQMIAKVEFDFNTPSYVTAYGGDFANCSDVKSLNIQKGSWISELPTFNSDILQESLLEWVIDGTTKVVDNYTQICGDITLKAVWDESSLITDFGYTNGLIINGQSIVAYNGSASSVNLPNYVLSGNQVKRITAIGESAFEHCSSLNNITIPNSVTTIGKSAFKNSGLLTIELPNSITTIGESAFEHCSILSSANIPNGVEVLEMYVFYGSNNLKVLNISKNSNLKIIKHRALLDSPIEDLYIPSKVEVIENQVFGRYDYKSITIDSSIIANNNSILSDMLRNTTNSSKIYVKRDIQIVGSNYLTSYFTKQESSDKTGYDLYMKQ